MGIKKINPGDPESASANVVEENVKLLKRLFPELVTEGEEGWSVNVDVLKQLVGDRLLTDADEKYGLNWFGKRRARQLALTPSTGTLRPAPEESEDWDTTQNLFIEGDNLEVLKLLQKSYAGKVKLIYIDPPYNTGKDFVYKDDFRDNIRNYKRLTGQVDEEGSPLTTNTESSGRFHTDWLNMMYPRLKLARTLLRKDGVMFVSIDEHELPNLEMICHEIFGEENTIGNIPVVMNLKGNQDAFGFAETHEYFIACCKSKADCSINEFSIPQEEILSEWKVDDYGLYKVADNLRATGVNAPREKRPNLWYPIFLDTQRKTVYCTDNDLPKDSEHVAVWPVNSDGEELSWYWSKETLKGNVHNLIIKKTKNGWQFYRKQRPSLGDIPTRKPKSFFYKPDYSTGTSTTKLKEMMGQKVFSAPKPVPFLRDLVEIGSHEDSIVLDFFAGSGTTAHAVMAQNAKDGGSRRYILVQLPEPLDPQNKEQKTAAEYCDRLGKPRNIAELAKERLRRAAVKVKEEHPEWNGDTGFRVFKLDSSNIKSWNPQPADLERQLEDMINPLLPDRTPEDVLYELLLKLGLDLCVPIEVRELVGKTIYSVGGGVLMTCLDKDITTNDVERLGQGIVSWRKELDPAAETTVVFLDSAFENDVAKANLVAILEQGGITNIRSL